MNRAVLAVLRASALLLLLPFPTQADTARLAAADWGRAPLRTVQATAIDLTQNPAADITPNALLAYAETAQQAVGKVDLARVSLAQAVRCRARYRLQQVEEAAKECAAAEKSARAAGDPTALALSLRGAAVLELTAGRAAAAGTLLAEAQGAAEKSGQKTLLAAIAVYQAIAAELSGLGGEATGHYARAYDLAAHSADKSPAVLASVNLGMWHVMQREPEPCLRRVEDGLRLASGPADNGVVRMTLQATRAQCLVLAERPAEALRELQALEKAAGKDEWVLRGHIHVALAQALIALRRPAEAVTAARQSARIAAAAPVRVAWANLTLAEALVANGQPREALQLLREINVDTLGIADGRVDALTRLGRLLQEQGDTAEAARFMSLALSTHREADARRSREMLAFLSARLDGDRQRAELALLQTRNAASEAEAERAAMQRNGVILVALLLAAVAALWWRTRVDAQVQARLSRELAQRQATLDEQAARQRALEQELDHKRRLEALGRLTAGVAHDFNNLMAVVLQVAGRLQRHPAVGTDPQALALVDEAALAARTGGEITRQLLAFGGRQTLHPARIEMDAYLQSVRPLLESSAGHEAQLEIAALPFLPAPVADRAGLTAALINLVVNARHAIAARQGGGRIDVSARAVDVQANDPTWPVLPAGRYLALQVTDDGCGMTPEVLEKCVEPFFSTGDAREGGGLGLSMVQGFARQSGGDLRITSEAGAGTQVTLLLPVTEAA